MKIFLDDIQVEFKFVQADLPIIKITKLVQTRDCKKKKLT